jgi:excisionase family DNA binding protein
MSAMATECEFKTIREAARMLRATPQTVRRWVQLGLLPPPVRLGRKRLFDATEIAQALANLRAEKE